MKLGDEYVVGIEKAQYIIDEYTSIKSRVIKVSFTEPLSATIHLANGQTQNVSGKLAVDLHKTPKKIKMERLRHEHSDICNAEMEKGYLFGIDEVDLEKVGKLPT